MAGFTRALIVTPLTRFALECVVTVDATGTAEGFTVPLTGYLPLYYRSATRRLISVVAWCSAASAQGQLPDARLLITHTDEDREAAGCFPFSLEM